MRSRRLLIIHNYIDMKMAKVTSEQKVGHRPGSVFVTSLLKVDENEFNHKNPSCFLVLHPLLKVLTERSQPQ